MSRNRRPAPLERGDTVAVIATGFAPPADALDAGLARLRRMGFVVREGKTLRAREGYLAGDDALRAAELRRALAAPEVRAVWFARGGYGTARVLDAVPWAALRRSPRWLVGYSDLTALFNIVARRAGSPCLYGPVVTELGEPTAWHGPSLRALLDGRGWSLRLRASQVLRPGRATGRLIGGNLCVLTHLLGTRHRPEWRDAVLFLEEIGEPVYRVDRMLTQLAQSGALDRIRGVLLGEFVVPPRTRFPGDRRLADVFEERFGPLGVPVVTGVPAGHRPRKRTLPIGGRVRIDTAARRVELEP